MNAIDRYDLLEKVQTLQSLDGWKIIHEHDVMIAHSLDVVPTAELTAAHARIAELEAEVASREQSGIEEHNEVHYWRDRVRKAESDLSALQSHDKEAMELLDVTSKYVPRRCSYCKHFEGDFNYDPCGSCGVSKCSVFSDDRTCKSGNFEWANADRYEALKA